MTTLIAGCGYVGSALAERLVARGERVIALTRSERALPAGVEPLVASLPDPSLVVPRGIDRLVYAVAPGRRDDDAYRRAYPEGLASVLDALDRADGSLSRAVLVSSTAVYAQDDGSVVDERSPPRATGTASRVLSAEALLAEALGTRGVVLRLSGIYGPGRDRIVRSVREGRLPEDAERIGNRIHRDDAAAAIDHLLAHAAPDALYVGTDEASVPFREVYAWLASALGVALSLPAAAGPPSGKRLDGSRLRSTGFTLRYPTFREGYAALLTPRSP